MTDQQPADEGAPTIFWPIAIMVAYVAALLALLWWVG